MFFFNLLRGLPNSCVLHTSLSFTYNMTLRFNCGKHIKPYNIIVFLRYIHITHSAIISSSHHRAHYVGSSYTTCATQIPFCIQRHSQSLHGRLIHPTYCAPGQPSNHPAFPQCLSLSLLQKCTCRVSRPVWCISINAIVTTIHNIYSGLSLK